jgi:hypothetical protein
LVNKKLQTAKNDAAYAELIKELKTRFEKNMHRHKGLSWSAVQSRLEVDADKLHSLLQMEETGGEPDVIAHDAKTGAFVFCDCSPESPAERRSLCYDREALDERKTAKPAGDAQSLAAAMGIVMLDEATYRQLQELGPFDLKTSSWLSTPDDVRAAGGAIFGDYRYGRTFIYHNGASSYYGARGFRAMLKV